ncbi:MAG TPA: TetR/AcrR family transcriptional regulator [Candidatus Acidoferrum sp.]|jgi:AcrR family transcriptional regulator
MSKRKRRVPQQDRGERRVAEVLEAAAAVIAEVGYEAATMTEMAERAGASIGALYQYFPNKEAIARALRQQYGNEMEARWALLTAQGSRLDINQLVDKIFDLMINFMKDRPAYIPLLNVPRNYKRDPAARNRLRQHFTDLFREKRPDLTQEAAFRIANVTVQVVKGMNPLYADAKPAEREEIVREFKLLLTTYLSSRLHS